MNRLLDSLFPLRNIRNVSMFYILSAVYNSWIVAGVWVFIWGAFMTKTQIGISDSLTFAVGFLIELPSGVFADMIGRRKAIVIGNILLTIGNLFVGLSGSFLGITAWYMVWTIGYAFQSGATEAHTYDSLKKINLESEWHRVISTSTIIAKTSTLVCTALGGYLFIIGFRLPYLTTAVISAVGIVAALKLRDIPVAGNTEDWSLKAYLTQIKNGVGTLSKRQVLPVAVVSLVITGIGYMYNWGLLRPLTGQRFGFTPTTYSLLLAVTSFIGIFSIVLLRRLQKVVKPEYLIFSVGIFYAFLFFILGFPHRLVVGGLIMILLAIGLTYVDISFSQFINRHTKEEHRATTLSAVALFTKMPYVLLALIIGKIADKDLLPQYTLIVGSIAIIIWIFSALTFANRTKEVLVINRE